MASRRQLLGGLGALGLGRLGLGALGLGALGCARRWTVRLAPSAWPAGSMALAPVRFEGAVVDGTPEARLAAILDDEDRQRWAQAEAALGEGFAERFAQRAQDQRIPVAAMQDAVVTLVPRVLRIETGVFLGVSGQPSHVVIEVEAITIEGVTLARVELEHRSPSSMRFRSLDRRLRHHGEQIAEELARFLVAWRDDA